jgi:hypothetical protein
MFKIPDPELQIDFSGVLAEIRGQYLHDALSATVKNLDITELDKALSEFVPKARVMFPYLTDGSVHASVLSHSEDRPWPAQNSPPKSTN